MRGRKMSFINNTKMYNNVIMLATLQEHFGNNKYKSSVTIFDVFEMLTNL